MNDVYESVRDDSKESSSLLDGLISKESNPYLTTKADRLRAKFGESIVKGTSEAREVVEDRLASDLAQFKSTSPAVERVGSDDDEDGPLQKVINTLGTVLTYNFFIIITFFLWFVAGVGMQYGAQNYALIGAFQGAWDVLILPLLSTHMALTFLSAGLERVAGGGEEA